MNIYTENGNNRNSSDLDNLENISVFCYFKITCKDEHFILMNCSQKHTVRQASPDLYDCGKDQVWGSKPNALHNKAEARTK